MTRQNIYTGASANDGTGDTLRQISTKVNANFVEIWRAFGGDSDILTTGVTLTNETLVFEGSIADAFETTFGVINPTADRSINLPDLSGDVILDSGSQSLWDKTLINPVLSGPILSSMQIQDTSADHQYIIGVSELSADRTITLPLLTGNDTLVFESHTATLTNKTLNNPRITGSINGNSGNEILKLTSVGSAINEVTLSNAASGNAPSLKATGPGSNVNIELAGKGSGSVQLGKVANIPSTITANGAASNSASYIICNKATALAISLADGTVDGEEKIFTNKGVGIATITPTSFAQGTTFALAQFDGCRVIWDGTNWYLIGNQGEVTVA